jgi:hypothetical protein
MKYPRSQEIIVMVFHALKRYMITIFEHAHYGDVKDGIKVCSS